MRKRSEPHTFGQRLDAQRLRLEDQMSCLPGGSERDAVATRIEQLRTAAEMHDFLMLRDGGAASR